MRHLHVIIDNALNIVSVMFELIRLMLYGLFLQLLYISGHRLVTFLDNIGHREHVLADVLIALKTSYNEALSVSSGIVL